MVESTDVVAEISRDSARPAASLSVAEPLQASYDAFISYNQRDKPIAQALRSVIQTIGKPWWKARSLNVFLDATSLSAAPSLWAAIESRLSRSRYLILLASHASAASKWVDKEVACFIGPDGKGIDRLLIGLTEGELRWDETARDFKWDDSTPLCPSLRGRFEMEPLWVDLRAYRDAPTAAKRSTPDFLNAALDLAATIRGVEKSDLYSDELRRRKRNLRTAYGIAVVLAALAVGAGVAAWYAVHNERLAFIERNRANLERDNALTVQSRFLADMARQETAKGDYGSALALALEALPDSKRGISRPRVLQAEVAAYGALSSLRERRVLRGHQRELSKVAFSPDGKRVVTASADRTARIWDVATGSELVVLRGHELPVKTAAFSADGKRIVTADREGVKFWSALTGSEISMKSPINSASSAAFSPDGQRIAVGTVSGRALIWDIAAEAQTAVLQGHVKPVVSVAFSPDGKLVVTGSDDGTVRLWDATTGQELRVLRDPTRTENDVKSVAFSRDGTHLVAALALEHALVWDLKTGKMNALRHRGQVYSAVFSPDGNHVLTASGDTALVWDLSRLRPNVELGGVTAVFSGQTGLINAADFSPDGRTIATASADTTARLWTVKTLIDVGTIGSGPAPKWPLPSHRLAVASPDGKRLLTVLPDGTARLWDVSTGVEVAVLGGHQGEITVSAFSPDGTRIVTASADQVARVWDAATGLALATLKHDMDQWKAINSADFSSDGARLVTASADGLGRVWDVLAAREIAVLRGARINRAAFSPNATRVVTVCDDRTARVWDASSGREMLVLRHPREVLISGFSPDGKSVVTATGDSAARIWDADSGSEIMALANSGYVRSIVFSADGGRIATASDNSVRIWNAATGKLINELGGVISAAFSPDGTRILTPSQDGAIWWDLSTGTKIAEWHGHTATVYSAQFSPDGTRILTASADRTARLWRAFPTLQDLVDYARSISPRELTLQQRKQFFLE